MTPFNSDEPDLTLPEFMGGTGQFFSGSDNEPRFFPEPIQNAEVDGFDPRYADDVEGLMYLGHLTHSFRKFGHEFVLQTLKAGERLIVLTLVKEFENTIGLDLAFQIAHIAASLVSIDGQKFVEPLGAGQDARRQQIVITFNKIADPINGWYDAVIEQLYNEYSLLIVRQARAFQELEGKLLAGLRTP